MLILCLTVTEYSITEFQNMSGHIPWMDIAENLHDHLSKRSQVDLDYHLEEPSHMKANAVNFWLRHC
jgi:hypothetical protein